MPSFTSCTKPSSTSTPCSHTPESDNDDEEEYDDEEEERFCQYLLLLFIIDEGEGEAGVGEDQRS